MAQKLSFVELPCERCGSKKTLSKQKKERIENSFDKYYVEVSYVVCTNKLCQDSFEKQREIELISINNRKLEREERNKNRQSNIAKTIAARKVSKL